jgi:D-arabinose 1-dehydrogenase-like Zn-dependent alcohol dehydrogenase
VCVNSQGSLGDRQSVTFAGFGKRPCLFGVGGRANLGVARAVVVGAGVVAAVARSRKSAEAVTKFKPTI